MALVEARDLGRDFPGVSALDGVDLALEAGRVHVLAGENGAGKSTLVRLLTGVDRPTRGSLSVGGRDALRDPSLFATVAFVPQEPSLFEHLSVAENLMMPFARNGLGGAVLGPARIAVAARPLMERFGIRARPGDRVRDISVPDRQLLQIARAAASRAMRVLILDEPTSSLSAVEVERVFAVMRQLRDEGCAILFISHRLDEVFAIGDDVTVLVNGRKVSQGPLAQETPASLVKAMSGADVRFGEIFRQAVRTDAAASPLLEVSALSGPGFGPASFKLLGGEILGFAGLVGSGRTALMQAIFGYRKARSGSVRLAGSLLKAGSPAAAMRAGMVYLPEERQQHGLFARLSLSDNIGIALDDRAGRFVISRRREQASVAAIIAAYGIRTAGPKTPIATLSGGNQQKAIIGRALARRPRVAIFDEPTRGIDVRTKVEVYRIIKSLAEEGVGIILVSSELAELQKCATRIITMHSGVPSGDFPAAGTDGETLLRAMFGQDGHQGGQADVA